jgi:DNA-binding CsgD family transcriptional regulator
VWRARQWSDLDEVRALIARMARQAEAAGFDSLAGSAQTETLAHLAAIEGDLDGAIAHLDEGRRSDWGQANWKKSRWLMIFRAGLALEANDLGLAARLAEEARPSTERTLVSLVGLDLHLACRRGDLAEARPRLDEFMAAVADEGFASATQVHDIMTAALRAGVSPEDLRPLVELTGSYVGHRYEPDEPWRRFLDAQLAEAEGWLEEATGLYQAAAGHLDTSHEALAGHRGTIHVGAARCLIGLGRLEEARRHAEAAATELARWRGWRVDELRAVERRLGMGPEPSGPDSLTPREREVAALLAEGLTNSQVADRLYISPRTAAVHVSNILAKLGMSSRTEVAAWAVREGVGSADR